MPGFYDSYDVAVVGAGHAGIEAALAAARMGLKTLVITQSVDAIGRMSCNPSIGGIAKGNIVCEIDALGGQMAKLIDRSMIQFRLLNKSRGPAVQAPRSQADKILYSQLARQVLESTPNLSTLMDTVVDIIATESDQSLPPNSDSSAAAGSIPGALLLKSVDERTAKLAFGFMIIALGTEMFVRECCQKRARSSKLVLAVIGVTGGLLCGLYGVGSVISSLCQPCDGE